MRSLYAALFLCLLSCDSHSLAHADEASQTNEALFEDLGEELLKPSTDKPVAQLVEDMGKPQAAEDDWLSKVVAHMQTAQTLLERSDESPSASAAQAEALTGLDAMIAELMQRQSQCSGGQCDKPGAPKPGKKPHSSKKTSSSKTGKNPAQSAPATANSGADLSTELAVAGELVKDLWGQLPERQREQILQPLSEEFLPKYASEIEAYFRALADSSRTLADPSRTPTTPQ